MDPACAYCTHAHAASHTCILSQERGLVHPSSLLVHPSGTSLGGCDDSGCNPQGAQEVSQGGPKPHILRQGSSYIKKHNVSLRYCSVQYSVVDQKVLLYVCSSCRFYPPPGCLSVSVRASPTLSVISQRTSVLCDDEEYITRGRTTVSGVH